MTTWRKSSRSAEDANCVEIAHAGTTTAIRDSKNPSGPHLLFPVEDYWDFIALARVSTVR